MVNRACGWCSKKMISKTVVVAPTTSLLTAGALDRLPLEKQEIGPNDSLSVIGERRM